MWKKRSLKKKKVFRIQIHIQIQSIQKKIYDDNDRALQRFSFPILPNNIETNRTSKFKMFIIFQLLDLFVELIVHEQLFQRQIL